MAKVEKAAEPLLAVAPADFAAAGDQFRKMADDAMAQSKETYGKLKSAMEDSQKAVEDTFAKMQAANSDLGLKSIAAVRKASDASLSHLEKLFAVKSVSEFVELQTAFIRAQTELTVTEAKSLQDAATKAANDVAAPAKAVMEDAAKAFKVA